MEMRRKFRTNIVNLKELLQYCIYFLCVYCNYNNDMEIRFRSYYVIKFNYVNKAEIKDIWQTTAAGDPNFYGLFEIRISSRHV
jgi:hypothetical protein